MRCPLCTTNTAKIGEHLRSGHGDNIPLINELVARTSSELPWHQREDQNKAGCVFFVQGPAGSHIQLGRSVNPRDRLLDLQEDSPLPLTLLFFFPGTSRAVEILHRTFATDWVRGDWFKPSLELLVFIYEMLLVSERMHLSVEGWEKKIKAWNLGKRVVLKPKPPRLDVPLDLPRGFPVHERGLVEFYLNEVVPRKTPR